MSQININQIEVFLKQLQAEICNQLTEIDGSEFGIDAWEREQGYGLTRTLEDSAIIERGGVNFSRVKGSELPAAATAKRRELAGCEFEALGLSLVIHPKNPYVPTTHMNIRFFIGYPLGKAPIWWFGGGFDLTPYYVFEEDAIYWHQVAEKVCRPFGDTVYSRYKSWCDDYFYLKHRKETRGIGGLFFDDLNEWSFERCFEFMQAVGYGFVEGYLPIVKKRYLLPFGEREITFLQYRRSRYVEFNLVYDRGTLFGLQYGGRVESIFISMPLHASWRYQYEPEAGSKEALLTQKYLKPIDWLAKGSELCEQVSISV